MSRAATVLLVLALAVGAAADTWHVNNAAGNDASDGRSEKAAFATIARAVKAAKTSDSIVLANTGTPYREAIALSGLGGTPAEPFVIEGNGAVVTGLKPLPAVSSPALTAKPRIGPTQPFSGYQPTPLMKEKPR